MRRDVITLEFVYDFNKTRDVYAKNIRVQFVFIREVYRPVAFVKILLDKRLQFAISGHGFVIASNQYCLVIIFIFMTIKDVALLPTI